MAPNNAYYAHKMSSGIKERNLVNLGKNMTEGDYTKFGASS